MYEITQGTEQAPRKGWRIPSPLLHMKLNTLVSPAIYAATTY